MNTRFQLARCLVSVLAFSACSALGQSAESWYQAGSAAEDAKNYAAAIADYQKALQYDSTYSSAWFHLGYAYLESHQFQQATTSFKKYLSLFDKPDEQGAWLMLGITYQDLEQYDKAADAFRALIRLTNERGMSYEAHYELGHSLCLGGQYSAAIDELQNAMQREEAACDSVGACADSENLRNYLGLSYYHLGRYEDALGAFKDALWLKPKDIDTHYFLGMTYARMGDKAAALDEYKRLQAANNKNAADLYTRIQKMDSGTAAASSGATPAKPAAKPQQTATQTASASASQCQGQIDAENYGKAVDVCRLAVASSPLSAAVWSNLGMAYFGSKRYDEAAQAYQQVTRITPKDARAQYGVGAAYVELKQFGKAVPYLREAVKLDANSGNEWYDLGHSLYEVGQYTNAAEALETAARLQPNDAATDYWLGQTYVKLRNKAKAQAAYERFIGPDKNKDQNLSQQLYAEISSL